MRQRIILLIFLLTGIYNLNSQNINLGDSTVVSLITCEPGDALYAKFGHTAIRIHDTKGTDIVFNYGIFDFRTEHFYWKFMRGHTDYLLGVYPTENFLQEYEERGSTVWEQELDLTQSEKKKLIELLTINYLPQNRMYRYNFVYDNCATRPYEMISKSLSGVLVGDNQVEEDSYRNMITDYLSDVPWADVGVNLLFGVDADRNVGMQSSVFLPERLKDVMQRSKIMSLNNGLQERKIVKSVKMLVKGKPVTETVSTTSWIFHPFTVSLIWLIIGIILMIFKTNMDDIANKIFDTILYLITGLAGLLIFFFMFFSEHPITGNNLNILWLNPMNIMLALMLWKRSPRKFFFFYNVIYLLLIVLYVAITLFISHATLTSIIPLLVLVFVRVIWREERLLHILFIPTDKGLQFR
ncbi:hypothetical protein SDC9_39174 [bioreactor metagenome]|jgi:hypothetical protein|uniref:Uncharacterized protein n=1 Tax=bioreactor metagenome TaxID=1076179 RepID=A0A644VNR8_9ZZZZ|nr:DUF4105 domain-containing protein [Paludibacter sp.]